MRSEQKCQEKNMDINTFYLLLFLLGFTVGVDSSSGLNSTASTTTILRKMQKILSNGTPHNSKLKLVKQDEDESFGGNLAGQILNIIIKAATGDIGGILGSSFGVAQASQNGPDRTFFEDVAFNVQKIQEQISSTTPKLPPAQASQGLAGGYQQQSQNQNQLQPLQQQQQQQQQYQPQIQRRPGGHLLTAAETFSQVSSLGATSRYGNRNSNRVRPGNRNRFPGQAGQDESDEDV